MVLAVLLVLVLGVAAPAWAQQGGQASEAFVVLSGRADVPEGQTVGDLVVLHGSSTVDGTVDGSVTAFDAPVTISGRVNGDVVVFNGRVELQSVGIGMAAGCEDKSSSFAGGPNLFSRTSQ